MEFNERKMNTPEWPAKVIETEKDFWDVMYDAKNQFIQMQFDVYSKTKKEEEIIQRNKEFKYLNLIEYIKTHNKTLSEKILNNENAQHMIAVYDELVERARNSNSKAEMMQIIVDKEEFIQRFNLGLNE